MMSDSSSLDTEDYCQCLILIELNLLKLLENFKFTLQKKYEEKDAKIRQRIE